jgi:hypothetical protein
MPAIIMPDIPPDCASVLGKFKGLQIPKMPGFRWLLNSLFGKEPVQQPILRNETNR